MIKFRLSIFAEILLEWNCVLFRVIHPEHLIPSVLFCHVSFDHIKSCPVTQICSYYFLKICIVNNFRGDIWDNINILLLNKLWFLYWTFTDDSCLNNILLIYHSYHKGQHLKWHLRPWMIYHLFISPFHSLAIPPSVYVSVCFLETWAVFCLLL